MPGHCWHVAPPDDQFLVGGDEAFLRCCWCRDSWKVTGSRARWVWALYRLPLPQSIERPSVHGSCPVAEWFMNEPDAGATCYGRQEVQHADPAR